MFISNKYTSWYYDIVNYRLSNPLPQSIYQEKHHIIPKGLGGNNATSNIVSLSAREHYICHRLLVKMTIGRDKMKMAYALRMMMVTENQNQTRYKIGSSDYARIKKEIHQSIRPYLVGELNPYYGKTHSEETKAKMRAKRALQVIKSHGPRTDETKKKLREANRKQFQDPAQIELRRKKSKELWNDPSWREKYVGNTGKVCYNNGLENKLFAPNDGIPDEFVIGSLPKGRWVYNPQTGHSIMLPNSSAIPAGYINGRAKRNWYYDPITSQTKQFLQTEEIPDNYVKGRPQTKGGSAK